eukprot:1146465-Pelagomonas_calceolata.AAC.1
MSGICVKHGLPSLPAIRSRALLSRGPLFPKTGELYSDGMNNIQESPPPLTGYLVLDHLCTHPSLP